MPHCLCFPWVCDRSFSVTAAEHSPQTLCSRAALHSVYLEASVAVVKRSSASPLHTVTPHRRMLPAGRKSSTASSAIPQLLISPHPPCVRRAFSRRSSSSLCWGGSPCWPPGGDRPPAPRFRCSRAGDWGVCVTEVFAFHQGSYFPLDVTLDAAANVYLLKADGNQGVLVLVGLNSSTLTPGAVLHSFLVAGAQMVALDAAGNMCVVQRSNGYYYGPQWLNVMVAVLASITSPTPGAVLFEAANPAPDVYRLECRWRWIARLLLLH